MENALNMEKRFSVLFCGRNTGIVLINDASRRFNKNIDQQPKSYFETLEEARAFANQIFNSLPNIEYNVYEADNFIESLSLKT